MYDYVTVEHVYKKTCNALMGFYPGTAHIVIKPMIYQLSLKGDLHKHNKQRVIMNPPSSFNQTSFPVLTIVGD